MALAKSRLQKGLMDYVQVYLSPSVGPLGAPIFPPRKGAGAYHRAIHVITNSKMVGRRQVSGGQESDGQ